MGRDTPPVKLKPRWDRKQRMRVMVKSQSQKLKLDEGYFFLATNGGWLLYRRDYELFFGQKTDSIYLLTCMTSVSHLVSQTKRLHHNEEGEVRRYYARSV
ncbi:hypothetical protein T01_13197, partial [Trichinella spiralis]